MDSDIIKKLFESWWVGAFNKTFLADFGQKKQQVPSGCLFKIFDNISFVDSDIIKKIVWKLVGRDRGVESLQFQVSIVRR